MKNRIFKGGIAVFILSLMIVGCDLLPIGGNVTKTMPAEDAKIEIRNANQEIMTSMETMMATPAANSLFFLMNMMPDIMIADIKSAELFKKRLTYSNFLNNFRIKPDSKSANSDDEMFYGYFEYSFVEDDFVLVEHSNSVLDFKYPADDLAYANQQNNAQLTISNLQFQEIASYYEDYDYYAGDWVQYETTESVPVNAVITQRINNTVQLSANYNASYNSNGLPSSMNASMEMGEYSFTMSYSGNNTRYTTKMALKLGKEDLMAYDLTVKYRTDMESVDSFEGYYTMAPIKLDGSINIDAIEQHMETNYSNPDVDYVNSQVSVDVIHTEEKAKIGKLEFRMVYDSYWEEYELVPVIVYNDDSYEEIEDIFALGF